MTDGRETGGQDRPKEVGISAEASKAGVPLTDEQIMQHWARGNVPGNGPNAVVAFARAILASQATTAEAGGQKCQKCNGEGALYTHQPFPDDPYFEASRPCPDCDGTGRAAEAGGEARPIETKIIAELAYAVQQPHEWGYRDPVVGGFVADNTPFDLANAVTGAETGRKALIKRVIERLQMDIDDGSRPDQWSMEDMQRNLRAALATPVLPSETDSVVHTAGMSSPPSSTAPSNTVGADGASRGER